MKPLKNCLTLVYVILSVSGQQLLDTNDECFVKESQEHRLRRGHIDDYRDAKDVFECQQEHCEKFDGCSSFSYSDTALDGLPGNCLLSRQDSNTLDVFNTRHFKPDPRSSYYTRTRGARCRGIGVGNNLGRQYSAFLGDGLGSSSFRNLGLDCYRMVRDRIRTRRAQVIRSKNVRNLQECKDECSSQPLCRSFNYKTQENDRFEENCELTRIDIRGAGSSAINPYTFRDDSLYDFYAKDSQGLHCDRNFGGGLLNPYATNSISLFNRYPTANRYGLGGGGLLGGGFIGQPGIGGGLFGDLLGGYDEECFRLSQPYSRHSDNLVDQSLNVGNLQSCKQACLRARTFTCQSLSYSGRTSDSTVSTWRGGSGGNCLLSSTGPRDFTSLQIVTDRDYNLYATDETNRLLGRCGNIGTGIIGSGGIGSGIGSGAIGVGLNNRFGGTLDQNILNRFGVSGDTSLFNNNRFNNLDNRFNTLDNRFNNRFNRFGNRFNRFNQLDNRFNRFDNRLNRLGNRFNQLDTRYDSIDRFRGNRLRPATSDLGLFSNLNQFGLNRFGSRLSDFGLGNNRYGLDLIGFPQGRYDGRFETVTGTPCYRDRCRLDRIGGYYWCETDVNGSWDYCCRPDSICQPNLGTGGHGGQGVCHVGSDIQSQWRPCTTFGGLRGFLEEGKTLANGTNTKENKSEDKSNKKNTANLAANPALNTIKT